MRVVVDSKNPFADETFGKVAELTILPTPEIRRENLLHADAVVVRSETRVGPELLDGTAVQFVGTATIGTDHVDMEYIRSRGIGFASAPGSNANSVAEYVATAWLVAGHRLGLRLRDLTLGVVGVGNVGSRVARLGQLLGMRVLMNDPPLQRSTGRTDLVTLDGLMEADVISLHVPLTRTGPDATYHFFDADRIGRMKPGAILMNTARGGVVETDALLSALRSGHLRATLLDVWEHEPEISMDLLRLTILGTPHIAGYSLDGKVNAVRMMYDAFSRHFGISHPWALTTGLPPAVPDVLTLHNGARDVQEILHELLLSCYNIERDDWGLRRLLTMTPDERKKAFRALRANYPVRREFRATTVRCAKCGVEDLLRDLGFSVTL